MKSSAARAPRETQAVTALWIENLLGRRSSGGRGFAEN
jgi:hypothetical protein